jgi:hypothetical protein
MTQRYSRHFYLDTPEGPLVTSAPTPHSVLPRDFKSAAQRSLIKGGDSTNAAGPGSSSSPTAAGPSSSAAFGQPPVLISVSKETKGPKLLFAEVSKPKSFAAGIALGGLERLPTAAPDAEADERLDREQLRLGLVEIRPCGLCRHDFRLENLPYETSLKAILEQRARWGIVSLRSSDVKPGNLYGARRLCSFCAQFFNIASCVERRRLHDENALHIRRDHGLGVKHPSDAEVYQAQQIRKLLRLPERETREAFRSRIRKYRSEAIRDIRHQREIFHESRRPSTAEPRPLESHQSHRISVHAEDDEDVRTESLNVLAVHEFSAASPSVDDESSDPNAKEWHQSDNINEKDDDDDDDDEKLLLDAEEMMKGLHSGRSSARSHDMPTAKRDREAAEAELERLAKEHARKAAGKAAQAKRLTRSRPRTAITASFMLLQKSTKEKLESIAQAERLAAEAERLAVVDDLVADAIDGAAESPYRQQSRTESVMSSLRRIHAERTAKKEFYLERRKMRMEAERSATLPMHKKRIDGLPPGAHGALERFAMYRAGQRK